MEATELAQEELRLLESVIARQERIVFEMRRWLYALLTALVIAKFEVKFCGDQLSFIGISLVLIFFVTELFQRVPIGRAIQRVGEIEQYLRDQIRKREGKYDGPMLCESLSYKHFSEDVAKACEEALKARVFLPYLLLIFFFCLIGCIV